MRRSPQHAPAGRRSPRGARVGDAFVDYAICIHNALDLHRVTDIAIEIAAFDRGRPPNVQRKFRANHACGREPLSLVHVCKPMKPDAAKAITIERTLA
jgi:hypothetical protein